MKRFLPFLMLLALCLTTAGVQAQSFKSIENNSGCTAHVRIYYFHAEDNCYTEPAWYQDYVVAAGSFASATAPSPYVFAYAEVSPKPCGTPVVTVGMPTNCGPCNPGYPSTAFEPQFGCGEYCEVEVTYHCDAHLMII